MRYSPTISELWEESQQYANTLKRLSDLSHEIFLKGLYTRMAEEDWEIRQLLEWNSQGSGIS